MIQTTPNEARLKRFEQGEAYAFIRDCGWYFTDMGGVDRLKYKVESWSHQERNDAYHKSQEYMDDYIKNNCKIVPIDSSFPENIKNRLDYFAENNYVYFAEP